MYNRGHQEARRWDFPPPIPVPRTVQKKLFTPTGGNRTTRTPDTSENATLEQHPPVRSTVVIRGTAAAFEYRSYEHPPAFDPSLVHLPSE